MSEPRHNFDVFLSHAHSDAGIVERLAEKLTDDAGLRVWLDKWILVPGEHWQQEMAKGLEEAATCAVCISQTTPKGWFREEIERALNMQARESSFRVIPLILPKGDSSVVDSFLELRTWVDFKEGIEDAYAMHVLTCGIRGKPPGRYKPNDSGGELDLDGERAKLKAIRRLLDEQLIDENIALEYQRRILEPKFGR